MCIRDRLVDGKCPDCGREVERLKEESYFFRLSKYQDRLIKHIEEHPEFIQPQTRQNEMINNFLKPGLEDLCVSRTTFKWGIPVTFDDKHIVYAVSYTHLDVYKRQVQDPLLWRIFRLRGLRQDKGYSLFFC